MDSVGKFLKDSGYLFAIPIEIEPEHQKKIIEYTIQSGLETSRVRTTKQPINPTIWKTANFRVFDSQTQSQFPSLGHISYFGLQYVLRYRTDLKWQWIDTAVTDIIKHYVDQAAKYFVQLTRVTIILLIPGASIPPNMDKVSGTKYDGDENIFFHEDGSQELTENNFHKNNKYLSFKIPISAQINDNGLPYVRVDNTDYYFNAKRNLYCMQEAQILHGVDACDFWRGIIYMDGQLNVKQLEVDSLPVEIKAVRKSTQ